MEVKGSKASPSGYKITCKNYPSEFILDKNLAKEYFRQFGRLKRLTFKLKLRVCTVEYANKEGFLNALNNAGEYKGTIFKVSVEKSVEVKKKKLVKNPVWVDTDDVKAELEAMGGFAPKTYNLPEDLTDSLAETPKVEKVKLKRPWNTETVVKWEKKTKTKDVQYSTSPEQLELINLVKSQAATVEEKYKALDARDKLIRMKLKKNTQLKSSPTSGTCPDMCPEKERLMRETKHQVALYEQTENGKSMNQLKAIKQYSRSSADQESPLSHELRPVSVLQMTMGYLMHNIIDMCDSTDVNLAEWYHFLWDRTRGIRKDITQQELCCQGAVELVEQCARFHIHCSARLVAEDPSVFDQKINTENLTKCLQSLKYMYHDLQLKGENCPNEAEFRAYIILLNLNDGNFMWEVQELRQEIQKSKEVKLALEVYSALDKNNYVKFFKLVYSTTYLNSCILMRYFVQVRVAAIKILLKCCSPRASKTIYPLNNLTTLLGFDDVESTMDFMQAYGISINKEQTHIILEKNTFVLPEFPYLLERSLNVVESKRTWSVGKVVCGKDLPHKTFECHVPQNSFDSKGYLVLKDMLEDSDLEPKLKLPTESVEEAEMSGTGAASQNIFAVPILGGDSIFAKKQGSSNSSIFTQTTTHLPGSAIGSIFSHVKREDAPSFKETNMSIFGRPAVETQKSIFSKEVDSSISAPKLSESKDQTDSSQGIAPQYQDQTDSSFSSASLTHIFPDSIFAKPSTSTGSIFSGTISQSIPKKTPKIFPSAAKPKGGFTFNLPKTVEETIARNIFSHSTITPFTVPPISSIKLPITPEESPPVKQPSMPDVAEILELQRKKKEEEMETQRRELEEQQRKKELEERLLEKRKREEERLRTVKKKKQEEELRRRMEELRKEEERLKDLEVQKTVKIVLDMTINTVVNKLCEEKLEEIRNNISRRKMLGVVKKWQEIVIKNKRKRKVMDCGPVWMNTKTVKQSAEELHTKSQDLTLKLMKRYKYGKPLDLEVLNDDKIDKVNLFQVTYRTLNKRFFELKGTLQKSIFWKVEISLPDHYELRNGLNRIEETLKDAFQWEDRNGTIMLIEQVKPTSVQSVTYCVERQRGLYVRYADANGIIFIAKDFNALLQRRIFENLKSFGVFTKVPIAIILQEYDEGDCQLRSLIDEKIVSDYVILIGNLMPQTLISLIEEALVFLASKLEKPPPLELDTLNSFLAKHICTETWKRANSFAKWNSHYKTCLRNPNTIISLYNEGLSKLTKIILNKSCSEYALFPEVFKEYLESQIPDFLPCNYCYFPKFWRNENYIAKLEKILKSLALPKWQEKWPPSNELELEVNVSKYCIKVFKEPEKPFYRIMSVLLQGVDPNANFDDIGKVLWTDVIEVLGLEKLRQTNLNFTGTVFETKSIFNQFVVVYDADTLEHYKRSDWFYINNPLIKRSVKQQLKEEKRDQHNQNEVNIELDMDLSIDLDKTINEVTNQLLNKQNTLQMKRELAEFNALLSDLESSIKIHKTISSKFEENLRKAIEDN